MLKLRHQLVFVYGLPLASDEPSFSDAETQWPTDFEGAILRFQSLVSERDEDSDTDCSSHSVSLIEFKKMNFEQEAKIYSKVHTNRCSKTLPKISMGSQCNLSRLDSMELKNEITYWQNEVIKMNEPDQPVPSLKENSRGNPFSHKIRECVLACISKNVPMQNISDVIASICQIFNVEEKDTLPSVASIHNISREAKAICNKQLEEAIKHSDNLTIMKDATTKQGRQFYVDVKKQQDNGLARGKNEEDKIMIMAQERKDSEILREKSIADDINLEQERRDTIKGRIEEKEANLKQLQEH
ncbi:unnamed protein product [Mytilus edulis]|uniref:Uncharacterized protein n=1 Tax=Mytilus edulis TaxID=6550 RepID=A0A8S3TFH7_MYTED|nr:unnamed protein product [Mytilus edulis]